MNSRKINKLKKVLKSYESVIIAFSGGTDSSFLLKLAVEVLGENVIAVTAKSPVFPKKELLEAKKITGLLKCRHIIFYLNLLELETLRKNPINRCYICKKELFLKLISIKDRYNFNIIADGTNYDDLHTFRPGRKALNELDIRNPLAESGLTREDIKKYSKILHLPTWNKPALSCLLTRFPYGEKISVSKLRKIEKAEEYLHSLGFKQKRVRYQYPVARIEIEKDEIRKLAQSNLREKILKKFKKIGFLYITLDLEGYRPGSMDESKE